MDPSLPFLDGFVAAALANGAAPYISEQERFAMGVVRPSHHDEVSPASYPLVGNSASAWRFLNSLSPCWRQLGSRDANHAGQNLPDKEATLGPLRLRPACTGRSI